MLSREAFVCVGDTGINGLATVRALGRRGIPVHVLSLAGSGQIASLSRYCASWTEAAEPAALAAALLACAERAGRPPVVYVDNDAMLRLLAPQAAALAARLALVDPVARAGELTDKRLQMEVAQRCGIAVPRTWCPESWKALRAIDSPRRLIAKPVTSLAQAPFKALIARDAAELEARLRGCLAAADEVLVQEYVEGGDDAIYVALAYRARSVERSYVLTGRKLRQSKPGAGIMAVGEALDVPEVRAMTERLLEEADARGVMCPEFKRDRVDGRYYFIEWNPRPAYFQSLGWKAGFDLAWLAWCDHADPARLPLRFPEAAGRSGARHYWINLQADLQRLACAPRSALRPAYWRPYLGPFAPAVFALDDPRPWLRAMRNLAAWVASRSRRWAPLRAADRARSTAARRLRGL